MVQLLEAVITGDQRESFCIESFIFHIIQLDSSDESDFIYLDEVELHPKQEAFFLERLKEIAEGTQYIFRDESISLREKCQRLVLEPENFVTLSKNIASDFSGHHNRSMSPGVFVVAVIKYLKAAHDWQKLIFLVKMDGQPSFSYNYKEINGKRVAFVTDVQNALNETKKSIQKSALIDVSENHAWHVLATDRMNKTLGVYFKKFLGVIERQQDSILTRATHSTVKKWAKAISRDELPPGEDVHTYGTRALNYLKDNDTFDTDSFIKTVLRDDNQERKSKFSLQLRSELEQAGIAGQIFSPRPESLPKKQRRSVYETSEGVRIEWEGDRDAVGVSFQDVQGGGKLITINTRALMIKEK